MQGPAMSEEQKRIVLGDQRDIYAEIIAALVMVESGGDAEAVGDGGQAIGCLQIHRCVVDDVNRIYRLEGEGQYQHRDAWEPEKARRICELYLRYWAPRAVAAAKRGGEYMGLAEACARVWNGGPDGWREPATDEYAGRVANQMMAEAAGGGLAGGNSKEQGRKI